MDHNLDYISLGNGLQLWTSLIVVGRDSGSLAILLYF